MGVNRDLHIAIIGAGKLLFRKQFSGRTHGFLTVP